MLSSLLKKQINTIKSKQLVTDDSLGELNFPTKSAETEESTQLKNNLTLKSDIESLSESKHENSVKYYANRILNLAKKSPDSEQSLIALSALKGKYLEASENGQESLLDSLASDIEELESILPKVNNSFNDELRLVDLYCRLENGSLKEQEVVLSDIQSLSLNKSLRGACLDFAISCFEKSDYTQIKERAIEIIGDIAVDLVDSDKQRLIVKLGKSFESNKPSILNAFFNESSASLRKKFEIFKTKLS